MQPYFGVPPQPIGCIARTFKAWAIEEKAGVC